MKKGELKNVQNQIIYANTHHQIKYKKVTFYSPTYRFKHKDLYTS